MTVKRAERFELVKDTLRPIASFFWFNELINSFPVHGPVRDPLIFPHDDELLVQCSATYFEMLHYLSRASPGQSIGVSTEGDWSGKPPFAPAQKE
jgi:hypothetical protein